MSIQWFPGHMHKARKQIAELLPNIHVIIEVLDARIPFSSQNPMINELTGNKPCIKVLTKSDLADPTSTTEWLQHFEKSSGVRAIDLSKTTPEKTKKLIDLCRKLAPNQDRGHNDIHVMIMGIPNVGKSTLINILAGKNIAKTGNEPAVTKGQQRINLRNGIMLFDTPGMLWPKVESEQSSYRLAVTGAIKDTAMSYDDVAFFAADFMLRNYPQRLHERFQFEQTPRSELELLELIGHQRGCLRSGGKVDIDKVSALFLNELRSGFFGPITLENPTQVEREKIIVAEQIAERKALKEARKNARKKRR